MDACSLDEVWERALAAQRRIAGREAALAERLGIRPTFGLLPDAGADPGQTCALLITLIESLAQGHERLLARLGEALGVTSESSVDTDPLKQRISRLIAELDDPKPDVSLEERLACVEQRSLLRQSTLEKLVDKAFAQGQLIAELRERLHAETSGPVIRLVGDDNGECIVVTDDATAHGDHL